MTRVLKPASQATKELYASYCQQRLTEILEQSSTGFGKDIYCVKDKSNWLGYVGTDEVREMGIRCHNLGGHELMLTVANSIPKNGGAGLDVAWDGIGEYKA